MNVRSTVRKCSYVLLFAGAAILIGCGLLAVQTRTYQTRKAQQFAAELQRAKTISRPNHTDEIALANPVIKAGSVLGELEIPRIGIKTLILEGDDLGVLRLGAGHIPGTTMPGAPGGNIGIAAHRDTYFRPLKDIRATDVIIVKSLTGVHKYAVQFTEVVPPSDVGVLDDSGRSMLTLVTCYPFYFVGPAPKRFIVRATALDSVPASAKQSQLSPVRNGSTGD